MLGARVDPVVSWYERKTKSIIGKYGPGPIIHFHTGIIDESTEPADDLEQIRRQLVESQRELLTETCRIIDAGERLRGDILDVGCGLGGASITMAQRYGCRVYALTNVPGHIDYVKKFSEESGVTGKVIPLLGDACHIPGEQTFDVAIAIESSCYIDRNRWFKHLCTRMKKGSHLTIIDSFTTHPEVKEPFDRYWNTNIGTLQEYREAAFKSGFRENVFLDLTPRTLRFWEFSVLHSKLALQLAKIASEERKLKRSIDWQTRLMGFWADHKITCALLHFSLD